MNNRCESVIVSEPLEIADDASPMVARLRQAQRKYLQEP
jgi:hypothetical protein